MFNNQSLHYDQSPTHNSYLSEGSLLRTVKCTLLLLCNTFSHASYNLTFVVIWQKVKLQMRRSMVGLLLTHSTVETTSFAPLKLDSPPLIFIYYLPYRNRELKNFVLHSDHYSSFKWRLYEKGPTLGL